ncbi:Ultraviolet-B receptor UVR8 [Durusdinium trenchii]|uniref:Ultraviolet-B receptor UVR8 n=1 Tax=Durusdinium trenchii TaxID=1381693 RepID=A0ABP0RY05_9DINO
MMVHRIAPLDDWEQIPGIEDFVRRAQDLELEQPVVVPLPSAWNLTECVIDALQAYAYLGQAILELWSAIDVEGSKCPDNTPAGCSVSVSGFLTSVSWVGAYISMAANACVAMGNQQATCANDWLTLTSSLGEIATAGAAVSEECDFNKDWVKLLKLKGEEAEEDEPDWRKFVPAGAGPTVDTALKIHELHRAHFNRDISSAFCAMDVTNAVSYLVREVIQIKVAIQSCPQPTACAVSIMNVLASFGWMIRFAAVGVTDCAHSDNQKASCAAYIADLFAGIVDTPATGAAFESTGPGCGYVNAPPPRAAPNSIEVLRRPKTVSADLPLLAVLCGVRMNLLVIQIGCWHFVAKWYAFVSNLSISAAGALRFQPLSGLLPWDASAKGGSEKHMPRMSRSDRAERFIRMRAGPGAGYCVSVIGQDSFFKPGSADTKWDDPQAIDHQKVLEALEGEIDGPVDLILFEGFKAFHEPRIVEKLDLLLWIDVKEVTSRERRMQANRKVTEEIFAEMWQFHLQYVERTKRLGLFQHPRFRMLEGELPIAEVLQHAIDDLCGFGIVDQRLVESVRSRSRSRGRDSASALLGSTPSQKRCANPSCWFFQSTEKEDGGYCCKKCHWRHVSGSKSGKNHDRVCGRSPAPKETPQAEPTPPSDPYPLEETKEENAVSVDRGLEPDLEGIQENPLFKSQFLCANPSCHFLVSRDLTDGNYCCKKCHWRFVSQSKSAKKRHNSHCAKIYVEGAARAPHRPPKDPYPVEE